MTAQSLQQRLMPAAAPLMASIVTAFLLGPRASVVLVFLLGLVPFAWLALPEARARLTCTPPPVVIALLLTIYLGSSLLWSADRVEGTGKVAMLASLVAAVWICRVGFGAASDDGIERLGKALVIAFLIGTGFLLFEEVFSHPVKRAMYKALPFTRLPEKHLGIEDGEITRIGGYLTKRNMAALCFVLWPALLSLFVLRTRLEAIVAAALAIAAAAITVVLATHETSTLALLAATAVLALAWLAPRLTLGAVVAGWVAATLLIVPAANLAYGKGLHLARWMPETARQRIILWGYTAEQVPGRLLTGVGVASTKILDARRGDLAKPPGFSYARRTGPHAHNIYLQTWYELGAIGALLLLALGLALLAAVPALPPLAQPFVLASFTSAAVTGAFTWSLWQTWFMAAFAVSLILNLLAVELIRRKSGARQR